MTGKIVFIGLVLAFMAALLYMCLLSGKAAEEQIKRDRRR